MPPKTFLSKALPEKLEDPGSFILPVSIGDVYIGEAMCDLGESISLMPITTFEKLERMELVECLDEVTLVDGSLSVPEGILEDVIIRIDKFSFPVGIIVLETSYFVACPLILGRDFLATARAAFYMEKGEVAIKYHDETLIYRVSERLGGQYYDAEEEYRLAQFTRRSQKGASKVVLKGTMKQELHLFEEGEEVTLKEPIISEDNRKRAAEWYGPFTIKRRCEKGIISIEDNASQRIMVHQS